MDDAADGDLERTLLRVSPLIMRCLRIIDIFCRTELERRRGVYQLLIIGGCMLAVIQEVWRRDSWPLVPGLQAISLRGAEQSLAIIPEASGTGFGSII